MMGRCRGRFRTYRRRCLMRCRWCCVSAYKLCLSPAVRTAAHPACLSGRNISAVRTVLCRSRSIPFGLGFKCDGTGRAQRLGVRCELRATARFRADARHWPACTVVFTVVAPLGLTVVAPRLRRLPRPSVMSSRRVCVRVCGFLFFAIDHAADDVR